MASMHLSGRRASATPGAGEGGPPGPTPRLTPHGWWLLAILCLAVAAYAFGYVVLGDRMYPRELADSFRARPWGIYPHACFGAIALAVGPFQLRRGVLLTRPGLHRSLGTAYLVSAFVAGLTGLYMSVFSHGGLITHVGFGALAVGLLASSTGAWLWIRRGDIVRHREWVIRSFALLFSAVTLRLWLPALVLLMGGFEPAYRLVAWLCWMPNLIAAEAHVRRSRSREPLAFLKQRNA